MNRDPELFIDLKKIYPEVRSLITVGVKYQSSYHPTFKQGYARVARYAWGRDYHDVFKAKLDSLCAALLHHGISSKAFTDAVPILERAYASKAGIGFIGKNSLLIAPGYGSFLLLGELLVNAEFQTKERTQFGGCSTCVKCRSHCPTGAIVEDRVVDARRCISYLTIEKRGAFSIVEREALGEWIFGCDICQDVCPFNHRSLKRGRAPEIAELDGSYGSGALLNLGELFSISDDRSFRERFKGTPLIRPKREGLIRNGLCVAKNTNAIELLELIAELCEDKSEVVRQTALWSGVNLSAMFGENRKFWMDKLLKLKRDQSQAVRTEAEMIEDTLI